MEVRGKVKNLTIDENQAEKESEVADRATVCKKQRINSMSLKCEKVTGGRKYEKQLYCHSLHGG